MTGNEPASEPELEPASESEVGAPRRRRRRRKRSGKQKRVESTFKEDQSPFRLSKNKKKRRKQKRRNFAIVSALIIAFLAASYFAVSYFTSPPPSKAPNVERIEEGVFEEILRNGTASQLTNAENKLEFESNGKPLPVVIDSFKKRLQVSNRMLEMTDKPEVIKEATVRKLRVLSQWDFMNVMNDFEDPLIRDRLEKLTKASLSNEDKKINTTANLVQQMTATYDYAVAPQGKSFEPIAESFSNTAEALSNNPQLAKNMLRICGLLNVKKLMPESNQLLLILGKNYLASDNETVQKLGREAKKIYLAQVMDLREVANDLDIDRAEALAKIHSTFDLVLGQECGAAEIESMNRLIEVLLSRNLHEPALKELQRMTAKVEALEVDPGNAKQIHQCLLAQTSNFGKRIDLSGLRDEFDNPYRAKVDQEKVKMMVFWSPSDEPSKRGLISLHRQTAAMEKLSVEAMAVFVDDGSSKMSKAEFQHQAKELPRINFYRVDRNTAEGKAFHQNCPVARLPYILLLDQQDQLQSINPDLKQLRSQIETIARKTPTSGE